MNKIIDKEDIFKLVQNLDKVKKELKQEFVGIDKQIDKLIEYITPWYLYYENQTAPTIINLWGMTGVGKTDLIKKLIKKLDLEHNYQHFDMNFSDNDNFYYKFNRLCGMYHSQSPIYVFDDIQYAAIKNQYNTTFNEVKGLIWDFMDTGQVVEDHSPYYSDSLTFLIFLTNLIKEGIELQENKIKESQYSDYLAIFSSFKFRIKGNHKKSLAETRKMFIYNKFKILVKNHGGDKKLIDPKKHYSIQEISDILTKIIILDIKPKTFNLRKALVFVIGNLDQLYQMSLEFSKIPADMLYDMTKDITIKNIKEALLMYFNPEHIARLGHNHVIYYSFKEKDYKKHIKQILNEDYLIEFTYSDTFINYLYNKYVFPTQGMRIQKNIKQHVQQMIIQVLTKYPNIKTIHFNYESNSNKDTIYITFELNKKKTQYSIDIEREEKGVDKNVKYKTALHESAHAVLTMSEANLLPKYVALQEKDADTLGLCYTEYPRYEFIKKLMLAKIRISLAGAVAERHYFDVEEISTGTLTDIKQATAMATMIYKHGLNGQLIYSSHDIIGQGREYAYDSIPEKNEDIKKILSLQEELTKKAIEKYQKTIKNVAKELYLKDILLSEDLKEIVKETESELIDNLKDKDNYYNYLPKDLK